MNILFVNEIPMNPIYGGIERVTDLLSKEWILRGHTIVYLGARADGKMMDYSFPAKQLILPFEGAFENPDNIQFYSDVLSKYNIDVVINQRGWAPFMNKALGCSEVKVISVIHTIPQGAHVLYMNEILWHNKTFNGIFRYVCKLMIYPFYYAYKYVKSSVKLRRHYHFLIRKSNAVVLLSSKCEREFNKLIKNDKSLYLTYAIPNPNVYKNISVDWNQKDNIILYVGRLSNNEKRPLRLLNVWERISKKHSDWKVVFVGDGDALDNMKLYAQKKRIERVEFAGKRDNVEDYYAKASFICLTSDFEGWGMTLTEGMSFGCIPFTFNNYGAASEIIDDGINGCLIPAFNLKQYARRLSYLMGNEEERRTMAIAALNKVQAFNVVNVVNRWDELFEQIL